MGDAKPAKPALGGYVVVSRRIVGWLDQVTGGRRNDAENRIGNGSAGLDRKVDQLAAIRPASDRDSSRRSTGLSSGRRIDRPQGMGPM